jgi:hypothetical protein
VSLPPFFDRGFGFMRFVVTLLPGLARPSIKQLTSAKLSNFLLTGSATSVYK